MTCAGCNNIEQHPVKGTALQGFQTLFAAGDGFGSDAFVLEHGAQRVANAAFIIND